MPKYDFDIKEMTNEDLLHTYVMYRECPSKGVSDEIRLVFLMHELEERGIEYA